MGNSSNASRECSLGMLGGDREPQELALPMPVAATDEVNVLDTQEKNPMEAKLDLLLSKLKKMEDNNGQRLITQRELNKWMGKKIHLGFIMMVLILLLMVVMMWLVVDATKDTSINTNVLTVKGSNTPIETANTDLMVQ